MLVLGGIGEAKGLSILQRMNHAQSEKVVARWEVEIGDLMFHYSLGCAGLNGKQLVICWPRGSKRVVCGYSPELKWPVIVERRNARIGHRPRDAQGGVAKRFVHGNPWDVEFVSEQACASQRALELFLREDSVEYAMVCEPCDVEICCAAGEFLSCGRTRRVVPEAIPDFGANFSADRVSAPLVQRTSILEAGLKEP